MNKRTKGKILQMPNKKRVLNTNDTLTSYENRLSIGQHAMMRDLIDGKLNKIPTGQLHMGTFGSLIRRSFISVSDKLDEAGNPTPMPTPLGLKAYERFETFECPQRLEAHDVTDYVINLLVSAQKKRRAS